MTKVPYETATSGIRAREEIIKILRGYGCESVGFMDNFSDKSVLLAFVHRGRSVQLNASAKGWSEMFLRHRPWNPRMRRSKGEYEIDALQQGMIAVNSILRDWVKGQMTAVEAGVLDFEGVFLPYMLTADGKSVLERAREAKLLPAPKE
jgi:hypothetical protein